MYEKQIRQKNLLIESKGIFFSYRHQHKSVLKRLNFKIYEGESIALVGQNGAGKSTLAKILTGILFVQSGSLIIDNVLVKPDTMNHVRDRVGLIFQNPNDQLFCPTVQEELEFGLINMHLPSAEIQVRVKETAYKMNIDHLLKRPPHHLSGGEKKKVAIAAILAMNPSIMIFDEPTANLDPFNEKVLTDTINSLSCTKIIISHDLPILFQTCHRMFLISDGEIIKDCSVGEFMEDRDLSIEHGLDFRFKCKCCHTIHSQNSMVSSHQ